MTQIKIEVPANDHIALSAMADALQRIATERAPQELTESFTRTVRVGDESITETTVKPYQLTETHDVELARLDEELEDVESVVCTTINGERLHDIDVQHTKERYGDKELEVSIHHENTKHDEAFEDTVNELHRKVDVAKVVVPAPLSDTCGTLDADGIPHDKRIHSKRATRLADNTWRLRKRPADKTEEEWTTYIDSVKAELKAVQDIPSVEADEELPSISIEDITQAEVNAGMLETSFTHHVSAPVSEVEVNIELTPHVTLTEAQVREEIKEKLESGELPIEAPLTPPVIDTDTPSVMSEANETPVAPVTPPTSLTPPVVEPKVTTFQELMLYMTSDAKKRGADNDMIKATLLEVDPALTAIPLIATRADLIPKFVTALEAKLK